VASAFDPAAAAKAGWTEAELSWEALQESAAALAAQGRHDEAAPLWGKALFLARTHFSRDDPRLATSLANHAVALRRAGNDGIARDLFAEALKIWDASAPWIDRLRVESQARSSLFHLRLEARHRGVYAKTARARLHRFAAEARAAVAALAEGAPPPATGFSRWKGEKPPTYSDSRKLLAAALLVAPG